MVAYRSSATGTQTPNTDGTTVTVTKPTGTVEGDVLVAVLHGYLPATLTPPSGFVKVSGPVADSTALYSWVYQKLATASEPANYTFTWSGTGGSIGVSVACFSDSIGVIDAWGEVTNTGDPAFANNAYALVPSLGYSVYAWRDSTADTVTATGATVTERFDFNAKDAGTIYRGQAGYTHTNLYDAGDIVAPLEFNPTNSVERGIAWTLALGDLSVSNLAYSSTGINVELDLDGSGEYTTDITSQVRYDAGITVTRGQSGEGAAPEVSRMNFTLDNTNGVFSPRNPNSPYFGQLGRNTPIRVCKNQGTVSFDSTGLTDTYCRFMTPDNESLAITGDIDLRIEVEPESWERSAFLVGKVANTDVGKIQWALRLLDGRLNFAWSGDGGAFGGSTYAYYRVPRNSTKLVIRFTLDIDTGAGRYSSNFYYSDSMSGPWSSLGSASGTGPLSISTANMTPLTVGTETPDPLDFYVKYASSFKGRIYRLQVRNGIAGTLVADVDFTTQAPGTKVFTDSTGNTWEGLDDAVISNRRYRFHGEVASWPARWDSTGRDVYVNLEAAGVRRRLETGETPIKSPLYRDMSTRPYAVAYWPCEDATNSQYIASGLSTGYPMQITTGTPTFAGDSRIPGSDPVVQMNNASASGRIRPYTTNAFGDISLRFYLKLDPDLATQQDICTLGTGGTVDTWTLGATGPGDLYLSYYNKDTDTRTVDTLGALTSLDGFASDSILMVTLELSQEATSIRYTVIITWFNSDSINSARVWSDTGTVSSATIGRATKVSIAPFLANTGIGHITVMNNLGGFVNSVDCVMGYAGESPATRFRRILQEEGLTDYIIGVSDVRMGIQKSRTLVELLKEAADSDQGIFYEPRQSNGLGLMTREATYNRQIDLELDYSNYELSGDLWPEDDDSHTQNDVTVTREGGSSSRVSKDSGPLSVLSPPNGVGRYDTNTTLSLHRDFNCEDHAGWLVHLGTVDEARYPKLSVNLENPRFSASSDLTEKALNLDIGWRLGVTNLPDWLPPEDLSLLVVGYTEKFDQFTHAIQYVCSPYSPYVIGVVEEKGWDTSPTSSRAGGSNSSLSASASSVATSLSVATDSSVPIWSTTATDFDIMVNGERMTVTAVSGTSSPQTFTVTRSVNGVAKTHASGSVIKMFQPTIVAL